MFIIGAHLGLKCHLQKLANLRAGFFGYFIFQIACALAPNVPALLIFRFLSGCFAACPLTNSGALLGDM
jgi:MFS family permease